MNIISIDPGAKGAAVVWIAGEVFRVHAGEGWATRFIADVELLVGAHKVEKAYIEKSQAMPGQGVSSMFRYGQGYGELLGACAAVGLPVIQVSPQTWQKFAYRGISGEGKARSIEACRRLLPKQKLVLSGCRKPHDGLADALLIGLWAHDQNLIRGSKICR